MDHVCLPVDLCICLLHGHIDADEHRPELTWNEVYDELGKDRIPEDHDTTQNPEITFVEEQGMKQRVSRAETTGRKNVSRIGHFQP